MDAITNHSHAIGRIMMGGYFLLAGLSKIFMLGADNFAGFIASKIPALAFMAWPVILFEIIAGLCILLGYRTKEAATLLALFSIFAGLVYHGMADMGGMLKNFGLAGGFFVLAAAGTGKWSIKG